jgi:hypothetical protein
MSDAWLEAGDVRSGEFGPVYTDAEVPAAEVLEGVADDVRGAMLCLWDPAAEVAAEAGSVRG